MGLLDKSDPVFGFSGKSAMLPSPWRRTVFDMNLTLEIAWENAEIRVEEMIIDAEKPDGD